MITVFRRELLLSFRRLYAYIVISACALASAIFFILSNLLYTTSTTASAVSAMQLIIAACVPVLAMLAFAPFKKGSDDTATYSMLPISASAVFFGKYLSALVLVLLSALPLFFYPLIAGAFGPVDHAQSYIQLLVMLLSEAAFLAFCALISICLGKRSRVLTLVVCYASGVLMLFMGIANVVISPNAIVSLVCFAVLAALMAFLVFLFLRRIVVSIVALVVFEAMTFAAYFIAPSAFVSGFERFLESVALFGRFDLFVSGILDFSALVFYAFAVAVLIFLAYRSFIKRNSSPTRFGARRALSAYLAAALLGVSILGSASLFSLPHSYVMADMTVTERNTVSDKAADFLGKIDMPITIYLLESTEAVDYELYLENIAACNPLITLEKVYASNDLSFYEERKMYPDYPNSLYIESELRGGYVSYMSFFTYSNATLGFSDMSVSEYQYHYSTLSSSDTDSYLLDKLVHDSVMNFNADYEICSLIEYVTAEIIPINYYLTGHGEKKLDANNIYSGMGVSELTINGEIPKDAASIIVNTPTADLTDAERDALLAYLERGGEITFITSPEALDLPNLCHILAEYGLSASKEIVTVEKPAEESDKTDESDKGSEGEESTSTSEDSAEGDKESERVSEFIPTINTDNDVLYLFEGTNIYFSVKDTNDISFNSDARPSLILTPLLTVKDGDATYTVAAAAETSDGAKIALFTGAESYNPVISADANVSSYAYFCPLLASEWASLKYESHTGNIPPTVYDPQREVITSPGALVAAATLIIVPLAFVSFGCVMFIRFKRAIKTARA